MNGRLDWQSIVVALLLLWATAVLVRRAWRLFFPTPGASPSGCGGGSCGGCESRSVPARELVSLTTAPWTPQPPQQR